MISQTRIAELVERENEAYHKLDPDPFDDRHPGKNIYFYLQMNRLPSNNVTHCLFVFACLNNGHKSNNEDSTNLF